MAKQLLRALLWISSVLVLVYLLGVAYAWAARAAQSASSPMRLPPEVVVMDEVLQHVRGTLNGDFGVLPGQLGAVVPYVVEALGRSMQVLLLAFVLSSLCGVLLTFVIEREQGRSSRWFAPLAVALASIPPFFLAVLAIAAILALSWTVIPVQNHWLLPVLVLSIRPTMQIARILGGLVHQEFEQQYVVAARGMGNSWPAVRRKHIWPNILAPAILTLAGTFRLLVAELVVVEWLLNWSGVGRLLASVLIVPKRTDALAPLFLHPHLTALTFTAIALLFVLADILARNAAKAADPRLRRTVEQS